jgi:hypothetical protein
MTWIIFFEDSLPNGRRLANCALRGIFTGRILNRYPAWRLNGGCAEYFGTRNAPWVPDYPMALPEGAKNSFTAAHRWKIV